MVQRFQKGIGGLEARRELLWCEVQQKRNLLAGQADFSRVEPHARAMGLRAARCGQVLALAAGDEPPGVRAGSVGTARRVLADVAGILTPGSAQAEARGESRRGTWVSAGGSTGREGSRKGDRR